jgi:hypothetical protein
MSGVTGGTDVFAANAGDLGLHPFGVADALDPQLVVDAEYNCPAVRIGKSDDALGYPLRVGKLDLEFEIGVLAAADQAQQFGPVVAGASWLTRYS